MNKINKIYEYDNFKQAVENSQNYKDVLFNLQLKYFGTSYKTIKKFIKLYELDISHFKFKNSGRNPNLKPLAEVLCEKSTYGRSCLKKRLFEEGLKKEECEICGQKNEWNGKHLIMILDHINGVNDDNRLENLRMVCPNCNYQLPTSCGRNTEKNKTKKRTCYCGETLRTNTSKYCSRRCRYTSPNKMDYYKRERRVERPSYETLKLDLENMSMVAVGKKYGVSDNAVRKWLKLYKEGLF